MMQATYSPDDNKLRLYSTSRLDRDLYDRVKAAGFKWAPKQELFVAPMWTPERENLLIELCGEVEDEDKSLVERAEERAERFEDYSDSRANDAQRAREAVSSISEHIPLGQPILVGHHSEKRARKDAQRIENGMRYAVKMWETSEYWTSRAAGAIRSAKYKERPDVRARRIKGLEADKRKQEKYIEEAKQDLKLWSRDDLTLEQAVAIAGLSRLHLPKKEGDREDWNIPASAYSTLRGEYTNLYAPRTVAEVVEHAKNYYPRTIAHHQRWLNHFNNRIAYEKAMLDEQGGLTADKFDIKPGGRVLVRGDWMVVIRVNKVAGRINSVTTNCRYVSVRGIEEINDYREPTEEETAKVQKATKLAPLVNYPGEGFIEVTTEEWKRKHSDYKIVRTAKATDEYGAYRYRVGFVPGGSYRQAQIYITDSKRVDRPAPATTQPVKFEIEREIPVPYTPKEATPEAEAFQAMKDQLKAGIKVVSAPQLFPTPAALAERMVDLAELKPTDRVLEPSAGTGVILRAIGPGPDKVAVEINSNLVNELTRQSLSGTRIHQADFLQCNGDLGKFDAVIMNPPFENAVDIKHITNAMNMLKPGGRLVAICANGPRQNAQLRPLVESMGGSWEQLPAGTFIESGTGVNTVLMSLTMAQIGESHTKTLDF
jgi:protein-L-isoaspartate O-methyltransferase